jgi:glycerol-3-phosphate dehydrogenase
VLSLGLAANDAISAAIMYLDCAVDVPRGHVLDARATLELAPAIPNGGLVGGAVWHDLALRCPGRVIIEALKWAADFGGAAVNYLEARRLLTARGRVRGVTVGEPGGHTIAELKAGIVVNAAGPWAGALASKWGAADDPLAPLLAPWDVLLDPPPLSSHAVALQDVSSRGAALKFATSLGGRLLVGTGYAPLLRNGESADAVAESELDAFLAAVNRCVPGLDATRRDILRVFSGILPAAAPGSSVPRARNLLSVAGPRGLFTVSGTKFTTARSAARRTLSAIRRAGLLRWPTSAPQAYPPCHTSAEGLFSNEWTMHDVEERRSALAQLVAHEAVEHLDDLVLRRTTLGDQSVRALSAARALCSLDGRWQQNAEREIARLAAQLGWRQAARAMNKGPDGLAAMTA